MVGYYPVRRLPLERFGMRLLPALLLTSAMPRIASGQTYTISTFAGGALPVNIPGTSASLGAGVPQAVASDQAGNIFLVGQGTILRLDAITTASAKCRTA